MKTLKTTKSKLNEKLKTVRSKNVMYFVSNSKFQNSLYISIMFTNSTCHIYSFNIHIQGDNMYKKYYN